MPADTHPAHDMTGSTPRPPSPSGPRTLPQTNKVQQNASPPPKRGASQSRFVVVSGLEKDGPEAARMSAAQSALVADPRTKGPPAPDEGPRSPGHHLTWLILPVVICLSQRLSHACLSISVSLRNCEWLIKTVIVSMSVVNYLDIHGNSRANTCVQTRLLRKGCAY